jgi:hypothetical protein
MAEWNSNESLSLIPAHMRQAVVRWLENGEIDEDRVVYAVACNDMFGFFRRADDTNVAAVRRWVMYFYEYAPSNSWGSAERAERWHRIGGMTGVLARAVEQAGDPDA